METFFGIVLILGLLAAAGWFGLAQVRQWVALREVALSPEDVRFLRWQTGRRLFGCGLMAVLAVMLAGLFGMGILSELDRLRDLGTAFRQGGRDLTPEERRFVEFSFRYVLALGGTVMVLFLTAIWDLAAIRQYGMRQRRRIRDAQQAMLAQQLPRLYAERRARRGENLEE
jgi:hypothetical protein